MNTVLDPSILTAECPSQVISIFYLLPGIFIKNAANPPHPNIKVYIYPDIAKKTLQYKIPFIARVRWAGCVIIREARSYAVHPTGENEYEGPLVRNLLLCLGQFDNRYPGFLGFVRFGGL
jgi:hypothetical protein